ncbi:MAG: NAD(P)/FAD-dependent oxidoreductase, partial [Candidatus Bipolaricaulaceae bacterium]
MRIAVIGAGAVGALIARELTRYDVQVLLFDREPEPGMGVTKANSAIVHAGFHDEPGTLRAKFCVQGNALFPKFCAELGVPFRQVGGFVLAFSPQEEEVLRVLAEQGAANGVLGLTLVSGEEVLAREPRVNPEVRRALWAPTVGIT